MMRILDAMRRIGPGGWFGIVTLLALTALAGAWARADSFAALWLTPDQQAMRDYNHLRFPEAADRFEDPTWQGIALSDAGRYEEAAAAFARKTTPEAFFNRGWALMKGFAYPQAIPAFELAVEASPDWPEAQENLALARYVLEYIERVRDQGDTGDSSEYGADDYVFDKSADTGKEVTITNASTIEQASEEKWMRSVDTRARDFLRSRFALEATREPTP